MIFREVGLVKDGAKRRRCAVAILDQTDLSESRSAKRSMDKPASRRRMQW